MIPVKRMTIKINPVDPFTPRCFGSRPSFAAYWPDTRFIELYPHDRYFTELLGREPEEDCDALIASALSVVHHERVHWQVAHSLSWGIFRSSLIALKTTLASLFLRQQTAAELSVIMRRWQLGMPPIAREASHDLRIDAQWSSLLHSTAEHAWICAILPNLLDHNDPALCALRPPEFMLGVVCQYLSNGFDARAVMDLQDQVFEDRVRSYKRCTPYHLSFTTDTKMLASPISIEECLAVISQLSLLHNHQTNDALAIDIAQRFEADLVSSIFGGQQDTYARCFQLAADTFGIEVMALDLSCLGLICELALDPPLPFSPEGESTEWTWQNFHPSHRFQALLAAAKHNLPTGGIRIQDYDGTALSEFAARLLACAGLERSSEHALTRWLSTFDEDTTQWPSEELAYEHTQFSLCGRREISVTPGILFDINRYASSLTQASPFFDLPYVLIDGDAQTADNDEDPALMAFAQHSLNAHLTRATDAYVFGSHQLFVLGLPRQADGYSAYQERLHEFFTAALHVEMPVLHT